MDNLAQEIWTEKYRPKFLKDVIGQEHVVQHLISFVEKKSLPHCLFAGSAGVGKTTISLCLANELFGENIKGNFLELNASDERGIETIRVKVKDFARTMPLGQSFKIIYLDESDSLTKDAQHALRRTMEAYASTTRFILACNYSSKIIPPVQSRCAVFRFSSLVKDDVIKALENISKNEHLEAETEALGSIFNISAGDMRKAINILQMAAANEGKITKESVFSATSVADPEEVKKMLETTLSGDFKVARQMLISLLYGKGLAGEDIIKEIYSQIYKLDIEDIKKLEMIEKAGEYEFRLTEGSNPQIQLEAMLANIALIIKNKL